MDWSNRLRTELNQRAQLYAQVHNRAYYKSLGSTLTIIFARDLDGLQHGNFSDHAYTAIRASPEWAVRLSKAHPQIAALPEERRTSAMELDSCTSSDALLMNIFCFPGFVESSSKVLGLQDAPTPPAFGMKPSVPLQNGTGDRTEVDCRIGNCIFEAKLTEKDFTRCSLTHMERYKDMRSVFQIERLTTVDGEVCGYQLIRNVLAASAFGYSFQVLCDARRPDLIQEWWRVHSSILDPDLRGRCGLLLWQELAAVAPPALRSFLAEKYGLLPAL